MTQKQIVPNAARAAFPYTLPILAGFTFLGIAYGIYMNAFGFSFVYPLLMSFFIYAGSAEFVVVGLLMAPFDPVNALMLTLIINARHLFYGISMLEKYRIKGLKRYYLIFGLCDESFSINYTADIPETVDKGWFMFFVTLLNQLYWVLGATLGGLFGRFLSFDTKGLEFVMTALFVVIFLEQWRKERVHYTSLIGLIGSAACLLLFGGSHFMIPSMILIVLLVSLLKKALTKAGAAA